MERMIGELGRKIRSKKAPFAHLASILYERQLTNLLLHYYPTLQSKQQPTSRDILFSILTIRKKERAPGQEFFKHLQVILAREQIDFDVSFVLERFGKLRLPGGVLHSRIVEQDKEKKTRCHRWFEAHQGTEIIFGEALAFYKAIGLREPVVVYYPLLNVELKVGTLRGQWGASLQVLPISSIAAVVGIWEYAENGRIYILRKHPGLEWLTSEERNLPETTEEEGEDD